jgi:hypothetical protein
MFLYFAIGAFTAPATTAFHDRRHVMPFFIFGNIMVMCLIGLRYYVGADWVTYVFMFQKAGTLSLRHALAIGDPGYQLINWLVYQSGEKIWLVNLICALIFVWGLARFCAAQDNPWLALVISIPYTVIVVAMGYTRQAVALGVIMAGLASYIRGGSPLRFVVYVLFASLFHKTAVVTVSFVAIGSDRNKVLNFILVLSMAVLLYDAFLGDSMDDFVDNYIKREYSSQGAAIRVVMNIVAAGVLFTMRERLGFDAKIFKLWRNFAVASIAMFALLFILPSSTVVDRISLYLLPLQIAVLATVPKATKSDVAGSMLVIGYMAAVQFVWMNFAIHSKFWVPYHFFPI